MLDFCYYFLGFLVIVSLLRIFWRSKKRTVGSNSSSVLTLEAPRIEWKTSPERFQMLYKKEHFETILDIIKEKGAIILDLDHLLILNRTLDDALFTPEDCSSLLSEEVVAFYIDHVLSVYAFREDRNLYEKMYYFCWIEDMTEKIKEVNPWRG